MAEIKADHEVARRSLNNNHLLIAYAVPQQAEIFYRVIKADGGPDGIHAKAADALALCAMLGVRDA